HKIAFCVFEKGALRSPRIKTANFNYVRLHGRVEGYKGNYSDAELSDWRDWLSEQGGDAYVYFDNTAQERYALDNALSLKAMCE
ncbi:MAG TPA: DUF72 domain-containing protein, partial [Alphaproteobacteria bacterium]|nr:DUF72 domain-containing protein [Alphaproteobacteria bacterium]